MTPSLCLPARIEGERAVRHFRRPRLANLFGLLARPVRVATADDPATRVPPFVERLWMPAYAVRLGTVARGERNSVWVSVDGWAGLFSIFGYETDLILRELEEHRLPPNLGENQVHDLARKGLLQYILRQRGQFNKPVVETVEEVKLYYFPLWVFYYRRGGESLDIRVLDGYTGKPTGPKIRVAVINALVAAMRSRAVASCQLPVAR